MTKVAIMQPTYLPWCGYFALMNYVDVFVVLDNVQFARRSWQQRNQIKTPVGAKWLTIPVNSKGQRDQVIKEVAIDLSTKFNATHFNTIVANYSKAPCFADFKDLIGNLYQQPSGLLIDFTMPIIFLLKTLLGIEDTQLVFSSDLPCIGTKADLLASICKHLDASSYVSPPGSQNYLEESEAFNQIKVPVNYFKFTHPVYEQLHGSFIPYMSVIDLLFNCGTKSLDLITSSSQLN